MGRNIRLFLFALTLMIMIIPAVPVLAASGNEGILKVGSRGDQVAELQTMLKQAGFFPARQEVTGYFGWITYNSVVALEKKYGLPVNGQAGSDELNILYRNGGGVVMGYYTVDYPGDKLSYNSLLNSNYPVNQVAMFDFCMDGKGNLTGKASSEGIALARKKGARTLMVVHNFSNGTFDKWSVYSSLSNKAYRNKLVNNIIEQVVKNGYDGVNIDFEGIPASLRGHFNSFLEQLAGSLKPKSKLLTLAVPAKTRDEVTGWSGAYDYRTIGRLADYVVIMTYDEHWGGGSPGPVASLPWVTRVLDYTTSVMPPQKVLMGLACYGYDWPANQKGKAVKWNNIPSLTARYGNNVMWDNTNSVPYLIYWQNAVKHQVWFENRYSLAIKLEMAKNYGLGGVAFWRMGFEDASFWNTLAQKLRRAG
ncbi:MAG: glycosyl hydrolase family 18 protein [Desulfocucumaceae bacterium]